MLPRAAVSLDEAHAAIELWEFYKRRTLDATQRLTVEVMMATRADGLWAASTTAREMPRQNGKGDEIEVVELWGLVQRAERILHTVHDAVLLATETQSRMLSVIEGSADLRRGMARAWRGTGQQMIEMRNGGTIWYRTRTGGGGRGVDDVDRIVVDEAQHAEAEHLAAITPTQLVSANPQLNALGSAGIAGKSVWWWQQRRAALSDDPGDNFGYVGHTAEVVSINDRGQVQRDPVDPNDRSLWYRSNPVLSRPGSTVGEHYFETQLRTLGPALFAREHMGVWDLEEAAVDPLFTLAQWTSRVSGPQDLTGPFFVAVDVEPDQSSATISVVGRRPDGKPQGELVQSEQGTGWVVERVAGMRHRLGREWGDLILDPQSPAGSLVPDFQREGIEPNVKQGREMIGACSRFYDAVVQGEFFHNGDLTLQESVLGATRKPYGSAWVFDRRKSKVISSPAISMVLALWGWSQHTPTPPRVRLYSMKG